MPGLVARSVAGLVLTAGHLLFAWHIWVMIRGRGSVREIPVMHDVIPVIVTPDRATETAV